MLQTHRSLHGDVRAGLVALALYSFGKWRQVVAHRREREQLEVVHQLTTGVLHELRQPLQVIHSQLEIVRLRPEEVGGGLDVIFRELSRPQALLQKPEELQYQPSLRTTRYARDDTMVDLSTVPGRPLDRDEGKRPGSQPDTEW